MAVFTPLDPEDAQRISNAHGLGPVLAVHPIAAGSVNSNFFMDTSAGRYFVRIYEEQGVDGVRYEWRLLDFLFARAIPVPERVPGPAPGDIRVAGKPTAVFRLVEGRETCQLGVTPERASSVGALLARAHRAASDFPIRREGRFGRADLLRRLRTIEEAGRPELLPCVRRLYDTLTDPRLDRLFREPRAVIHGDLFRDNVRFDEHDRIVAVIDWESASDGPFIHDVAVALVAFSYGDAFELPLATAMVTGYEQASGSALRYDALEPALRFACARFATTRITDYYLRSAIGDRVYKDYRRFLDRLDAIEAGSLRAVTQS